MGVLLVTISPFPKLHEYESAFADKLVICKTVASFIEFGAVKLLMTKEAVGFG
jgi:hypothetical protein